MKFNWRKFAGNYASGVAADIRDRREDAEDFEDEQEELARANVPKIQRKRMLANQAAQLGHRARALGATDAQIQEALSSGVEGINEFYTKLEKAASSKGVKSLGKADIEAIVNMPNIPDVDFKFADGEYQDFVEKTYGVGTPEIAMPDKEYTTMQKLFGFDAKDRAKARLADKQFFEGMSVAEINAAANNAEYESMFPNATMTFTDVNFFGAKDLRQFTRDLERDMSAAIKGDLADTTVTNAGLVEAAKYKKEMEDAGKKLDVDEQTARVAQAEKDALDLLETEAAVKTIQNYVDSYYNDDILNNESFRRMVISAAGEPFLEDLLERNDIEYTSEASREAAIKATQEGQEIFEAKERIREADEQFKPIEQEDPEEETPDTEAKKAKIPAEDPDFKPIPRPPSKGAIVDALDAGGVKAWDRNYAGKLDPVTGKKIMVEPRPEAGGPADKEVEAVTRTGVRLPNRTRKVTAREEWDILYGDTHNPDGTPKL